MKPLDILAAVLVIVGALNWGSVGLAQLNLVTAIFGQTVFASIVFAVVGLAGVYALIRWVALAKYARMSA